MRLEVVSSMIIQKHEVVCGFYFTVRTGKGEHLATSPHFETDGLCHQAALRLIDGARGGVNIMPVLADSMLFRQKDGLGLAGSCEHN